MPRFTRIDDLHRASELSTGVRRSTSACALACLILLLAACGGNVTDPVPDGTVSGTLGPEGGVIVGPDGMAFGVPVGNLDRDVEVRLARAAIPSVALPDGMVAEGRAYRISGSVDVFASSTQFGFVIGLPVPEGVDGSRVALAFLVSAEDTLDGDGTDAWYVARGQYDAAQGWFVTSTPALLGAGDVVVLVQGPDLVAEPATPPPAEDVSTSTHVVCTDWLDGFEVVPGTGITAADTAQLEQILDAALAQYRVLGFKPFLLRQAGWSHYLTPTLASIFALDCSQLEYEAMLEIPIDPSLEGRYHLTQQALWVYKGPGMRSTAFHELFHSLQARYLGTATLQNVANAYFSEGTAALTEALSRVPAVLDATRDTAYDPRLVDKTLLAPSGAPYPDALLPYKVQDFWAHVARSRSRPFHTFVLDFLNHGDVTPSGIDAVLRRAPYTSSFAAEHREWVLDQIFDTSTCSFGVEWGHTFVDVGAVSVIDIGASGLPAARTETLDRLTAGVFRATVKDATSQEPFQLAVRVGGDWAELDTSSVAVIQKGSSTCSIHRPTSFESIDGASRYAVHRLSVAPSATDELYIVLLNGSYEGSRSGPLLLDPAPSLIDMTVSPTSVAAESVAQMTFDLPFEDLGANLDRLSIRVELGGEFVANTGIDTEDSDLTSGFGGETGTGSYTPTVLVYCSEKGKNPLSFTLQLEDEIGFVSQEKSVDVQVDYGDCP